MKMNATTTLKALLLILLTNNNRNKASQRKSEKIFIKKVLAFIKEVKFQPKVKAWTTGSFFNKTSEMVLVLVTVFVIHEQSLIRQLVVRSFDHLNGVAKRGIPFLIQYVKETRNLVLRYISGEALDKSNLVAITTSGFPVWLKDWIPVIEANKDDFHMRILMSILISTRYLKTSKVLDTEVITRPSLAKVDDITDKEIRYALRLLKVPVFKDPLYPNKWNKSISTEVDDLSEYGNFPEFDSFHITVKRGPAGPALMGALSELTFIPQELLNKIVLIGGKKLGSHIESSLDKLDILHWRRPADIWREFFPKSIKKEIFRKISYFADKEGKTRVVGLLDYWSQTSLYSLHTKLNKFLSKIPMDCTFNQGKFYSLLPQGEDVTYHSVDLTAATDRMPLALQKRVIGILFGNVAKAEAWASILTSYPFTAFDKNNELSLRYEAGQPMGAYSSWPTMALTHHIIVQIAALRAGFRHFKDYALLGDDIVIANDVVATQYKLLLSILDMPFSPAKTHTSKDIYEFAKRWFYKGKEITGFSLGGYLQVWKKYSLLVVYLMNQESHGWKASSDEAVRTLVRGLEECMRGKGFISEHFDRTYKLHSLFDKLVRLKSSYEDDILSKELGLKLIDCIVSFKTIHPSWLYQFYLDTQTTINTLLLKAKMSLAEKDLSKFQVDMYEFNRLLNEQVDKYIETAWAGQPSGIISFLEMTISTCMSVSTPIVKVLNALTDKATDFLLKSWVYDPEIGPDFNLILNEGLGKYMVTKNMFSMKNSKSKTLAEAALVKMIVNNCTSEYVPVIGTFNGETFVPDMKVSGLSLSYNDYWFISKSVFNRYLDFFSGAIFASVLIYMLKSGEALNVSSIEPFIEVVGDISGNSPVAPTPEISLQNSLESDFDIYAVAKLAAVGVLSLLGAYILLSGSYIDPPDPSVGDLINLATPVSESMSGPLSLL